MRKTPLMLVALCAKILTSFAQVPGGEDTAQYELRKLRLEEINFVSGYYQQDGNHSGVTGGIGTEKLTDVANTIDLRFSKFNAKGNTRSLVVEVGADSYTSASSDSIAPLSGPSGQDLRIYPSIAYRADNTEKATSVGGGISYSHEFDYESRGINFNFSKGSKDRNRELGVTLFAY